MFLEDLVDNLTALFNIESLNHNSSDIEKFNETCSGNKECLLAIARVDNIEAGELVMQSIRIKEWNEKYAGRWCACVVMSLPTFVF